MRVLLPAALWGLLFVPLFVWLDVRFGRRAPVVRYPTVSLLPNVKESARVATWIPRLLRALAIGAIVLGLAHPEAPRPGSTTIIEGIDIALALDLSRSMRAEDFRPNRLEAAKATLRNFVRAREHDRIALVVFAGDAFLQSPLTLDHDALDELIDAADFSLAGEEGTAIGDALVKAGARLKDSTAQSRIIVLITDGESNRGEVDPENAARIVAALGIRVYAIGVGGATGAPIPIDDPVYGKMFIRNPDGSLLLTRLDDALLRRIAEETGGRYFNASDRQTLDRVLGEIDRLERSAIEIRRPPSYRSISNWFYLLAFALVIVEGMLTRTWLRVLP